MSDQLFADMEAAKNEQGPAAAIDKLIDTLNEQKDYGRLFEAKLLKKRLEMGVPLVSPTSFDSIPDDKLEEFDKSFNEAAREVGERFLADGRIPQAWAYFRYIRDPDPVREALDKINPDREPSEETEELINVALYEGANPAKGLEIMLRVNGTCNTVTAMDQAIHQMEPDDRRKAAALLVQELYNDLIHTVQHDVDQRLAGTPPADSLRELLKDRDWLFENDNYHIDVSHLNAVVRFARFLEPGDPELDQATQLAEYGAKLATQFQYPGDPPFDDFYPAHVQYFNVLSDTNREEGLKYFRDKIDEEPDEEDKPMIAYVLVDLLIRTDRLKEATDVAARYLSDIEDPNGFSFARLCEEAGRLDALCQSARERGDLVTFTAALLQNNSVG